jgi:small subunit ribosomal protein S17
MVHDPNSSLRAGDIVAISPGWRTSKHTRHVVKHIIAPFSTPLEERPPVPTETERVAVREAKRVAKAERRAARVERDSAPNKADGEVKVPVSLESVNVLSTSTSDVD